MRAEDIVIDTLKKCVKYNTPYGPILKTFILIAPSPRRGTVVVSDDDTMVLNDYHVHITCS